MVDPWSSQPHTNSWRPPVVSLAVQPPPPAVPVIPRKAQRHRKRHVPVGPAGIWFQNFQQTSAAGSAAAGAGSSSTNTSSRPAMRHNGNDNDGEEEEEEDQQDVLQNLSRLGALQRRSGRHTHELIAFSSPAWIAMQCDCNWVTPSLPGHYNVAERYRALRPHVPPQYTMLYELRQNAHHSQGTTVTTGPWFCEHCVVLVSNIHGSTTAHGWTVTLTDETGETLTGWLQPESVRKQLQQQQPSNSTCSNDGNSSSSSSNNHDTGSSPLHRSWFKTGCVWWLQNTTLFLSPESSDTETLSYLLLIGEDNVKGVWEDGASLSDQRYFEWMEQRNRLAVHDDDLNEDIDDYHEGDRDRPESCHNNPSRSQVGLNHIQTSSMAIHRDCRQGFRHPLDSITKQSSAPAPRTTHHCPPVSRATNTVLDSLPPPPPPPHQPVPRNLLSSPHQGNPHNPYNRLSTNTEQTRTPKNVPPDDGSASPLLPDQHSTSVHIDKSPFASFTCAETESTLSQFMDSSKQLAVQSSQSLGQIKENHNITHYRAADGGRRSTIAHTTPKKMSPNHKEQEQSKQGQVANNTPPASQRIEATGKTTASSRKERGSSSRKRRKKTDQSKLWTNTNDFDLSDDSDEEIKPRERRMFCDTEAKETTPVVKKSLFNKVDEFASILSSDEDNDDE